MVVLAHFPIGPWDLTLAFLKYLTLGFDLGICHQTGFFLGGGFGAFFPGGGFGAFFADIGILPSTDFGLFSLSF